MGNDVSTDRFDEVLTFGRVMSSSYKKLTEEEYDSVDLELDKVKMAFNEELNLFIFGLLKNYSNKFNWSFATPNSELFGESWQSLQDRYQLMDDYGKLDLYKRIGTFMIEVFLEKFPSSGEKAAVEMANVFKEMIIDRLRDNSVQAHKV